MTPSSGPDLRIELRDRPMPSHRHRAIRLRAGEAFEQSHRGRVRFVAFARVALTVVVTSALAVYLIWAMHVARSFG